MLSSLFAILFPFVLWPWAIGGLLSRLRLPHAALIGAISGPLWFGWLLGAFVLAAPGLGFEIYTGATAVVWAGIVSLGRKVEVERPSFDPYTPSIALLVVAVALLAFNTVAHPPTDHDILTVKNFVERLRTTWDFWTLPRYAPDARGYYYPLAHPPAMMSLLAWLETLSPVGWVARAPSAYYFVGTCLGIYNGGRAYGKSAAVIALTLVLSAGLFVQFTTNNTQDVFRFAGLAAALVLLPRVKPGAWRVAIAAGALLGLSATYHSIGVIFAVLVPAAIVVVGMARLEWMWLGVMVGLSAFIAGAYPYVSIWRHLGSITIPTQVKAAIPTVISVMQVVQDTYALTDNAWQAWVYARLGMFTRIDDWGWTGLALALSLILAISIRKARPDGVRGQKPWLAFVLVSVLFLLLVIDPGDFVFGHTGKRLLVNIRYPLAMLPIVALAAAVPLGRILDLLGARVAGLALMVFVITAFWPEKDTLRPDGRLVAEPGQACLFCSDHDKLTNMRGTAVYRSMRWLDTDPTNRCLTFREAEYFAWTKLAGLPYYDPAVNYVVSATSSVTAVARMHEKGLNCAVVPAYGTMRTAMEQKTPAFAGIPHVSGVESALFYEVEVWRLRERPPRVMAETSTSSAEPKTTFSMPLPPADSYALDMTLDTAEPVTVVGFLESVGRENDRYRLFLFENQTGSISVPFVNDLQAKSVFVAFSRPVGVSWARLRALK